jgi:hypothetical protein
MATPTTKQAQLREILRCGRDPVYFINEYCRIAHPQRGLIPFKTYPFQDDCVRDFVKHRFNVVLKSRQLGLSTVTAAYAVWMALFHKEKNILVIATKLKTAINFIKKVKTVINNLPAWLRISPFEDTRQEVRFKNGSYIQAIPTSEDAGRSEALSLLIVDEAAFIRNFEEIWTGLYPTLSEGGSAIILSTPNGVGGQYYQLYTGAEAKTNDFNPIKLMWYVHPEHDEVWFAKESRQFSKRKIAQEMLCTFVGSGDTYVNADDIAWLETLVKEPIGRGDTLFGRHDDVVICRAERDVWVWATPAVGHKYVMSADVSRGDSRDFSTFHVIDSATAEVVVEFRGKIPPDKFGYMLDRYGKLYNRAFICPENNTFGFTTCSKLKELKYPKLVYQNVKPTQLDSYVASDDDLVGYSTQTKSRELALSKLEETIRNKVVRCYSARFVNELRTFIWSGTKALAMKDEYDDLVMSLAIGAWLFDAMFGAAVGDTIGTAMFLKAISKSTTSFNTVPGSGNEVRAFARPGMLAHNVYRPQTHPNGHPATDDLKWLMS